LKALKLSSTNLEKDSNGKILNFFSNDVSRIETAFYFYPYLIAGPLQIIGIVLMLFEMVDSSILSGTLLIFIVIPIQSFLGKIQTIYK
jgi:ABC-type transport system involved in cytochrome bd biosynthesis fused ATPase/permease subunit